MKQSPHYWRRLHKADYSCLLQSVRCYFDFFAVWFWFPTVRFYLRWRTYSWVSGSDPAIFTSPLLTDNRRGTLCWKGLQRQGGSCSCKCQTRHCHAFAARPVFKAGSKWEPQSSRHPKATVLCISHYYKLGLRCTVGERFDLGHFEYKLITHQEQAKVSTTSASTLLSSRFGCSFGAPCLLLVPRETPSIP